MNFSFFLCLAACRMRSSACDTVPRYCVLPCHHHDLALETRVGEHVACCIPSLLVLKLIFVRKLCFVGRRDEDRTAPTVGCQLDSFNRMAGDRVERIRLIRSNSDLCTLLPR